jgi:tRNA A-37 threonylcarbamoyl transferase component Bud32
VRRLGHDDRVTAPDRFGRYRVDRRIGSGAFATVWLAHDEVLDAPVAVKVLADNWAHRLDVRQRFEEEARILRRADSDRVVRVHDIGELDDGRPYFVMTYASGGTLADRLEAGPLPVAEALRYGADIARGLAVVHQVGVIHRDVNPRNVLLRDDRDGVERVLVADLGLAKAAAQGSGFTLTVGTPGYMAPEQAKPGDVPLDRRADVYAVGAVVHHMLTGVAPGPDGPPPPVRSLRPEVPAAVAAVVEQALAPRPEDRFPSAGALADALDAAAVRIQAANPDDTLTLALPRPRRRRRRRVLFALLGVLVLLGGGTAVALVLRDRADVTVATTDGALRLTVPHAWAGQLQRSEWDLGVFGLPARKDGVALTVAPLIKDGWDERSSEVPGVFAGRAPGNADPARTPLSGCVEAATPRPVTYGGLDGTLTRRACAGAVLVWTEVVLKPADGSFTVYVQVKEKSGETAGNAVLDSLVVR